MDSEKDQIRQGLKRQRAGLSPAERQAKSEVIIGRCLELIDWDRADRVHCYRSITDMHEVDTERLLAAFRRQGAMMDIPSLSNHQPSQAELDADYDLIIVPMLGFDMSLHRLGYGGGYYDRLLAAHPDAFKVGLCFESGRLDVVPTGPHDVALDLVVTEDRVYRG